MPLWDDKTFQIIAVLILAFLVLLTVCLFPFRKKNKHTAVAYASIQSWLILAPIILILIGSGHLIAVIGLTCIALLGAKEFFKMLGIYHQVWFVCVTYGFIILLSVTAFMELRHLYDILHIVLLGSLPFIALIKGITKNMIQFICLSLLTFLFMGWGFLHSIWIVLLPGGVFYLIYLILLTELSDNIALLISQLWKRQSSIKIISYRRTLEGLVVASSMTFLIGYLLKGILPVDVYWWSFSLVAIFMGSWGRVFLAIICRDLDLKEDTVFIIGKGRILHRLDGLIFTTPLYYYLMII